MKLPVDTRTAGGDPTPAEPIRLRKAADAAGSCTITTATVPQGQRWLIDYVTVTTSGALRATGDLYVDEGEGSLALIDGTANASSAVAPYNPPRVLTQDQALMFVWAGAAPNATCTLRVEYAVEVL